MQGGGGAAAARGSEQQGPPRRHLSTLHEPTLFRSFEHRSFMRALLHVLSVHSWALLWEGCTPPAYQSSAELGEPGLVS